MPGLLDDPTFQAAALAQPPQGGGPPGMPAAMPPGAGPAAGGAGIPPQLMQLLRAALMGQQAGGGGLPSGGAAAQMGAAPQSAGPDMGQLPGSMAAAAGAMGGGPNSEAIQAILRMNKNRGTTPDPGDPGYVRGMKSLLAKGLISQDKYDALINDPHQYTPGGEDGWQGSPRPLSDY